MALARWKDLCIDAEDPARLAAFWSSVLGRPDAGDAVLRTADPRETIWVNDVPEPLTVKQRVHLDVEVGSLGPLLAAGARTVLPSEESGFAWTVMTDPEGGEFCAFVRDHLDVDGPARLHEIVVDTATATSSEQIAAWWAEVLGGRSDDDGRGFWWVEDVPGLPFDGFAFVPVPEPKTVKNRIHWDVESDDLPGLVDLGATVLAEPTEESRWHVCADPDGNEFCVFAPVLP